MATPPHYPSIKNVYYIDVVIEGDNHENRLRVIGIGGCLFAWMGCKKGGGMEIFFTARLSYVYIYICTFKF